MRPPKFRGVPSPALAKMKAMTPAELAEYARTLTAEIERLEHKLERARAVRPPAPPVRIKRLSAQRDRLLALREEAWHRQGPGGPGEG